MSELNFLNERKMKMFGLFSGNEIIFTHESEKFMIDVIHCFNIMRESELGIESDVDMRKLFLKNDDLKKISEIISKNEICKKQLKNFIKKNFNVSENQSLLQKLEKEMREQYITKQKLEKEYIDFKNDYRNKKSNMEFSEIVKKTAKYIVHNFNSCYYDKINTFESFEKTCLE